MSVLELTPTASDEGVVYTCHAAVPGQNSAVVENISVSFCEYYSCLSLVRYVYMYRVLKNVQAQSAEIQ